MKSYKSIERLFYPGLITYVIARANPKAPCMAGEIPGAGESIEIDGLAARVEYSEMLGDEEFKWWPHLFISVLKNDLKPLPCPHCASAIPSNEDSYDLHGIGDAPCYSVVCNPCGLSGPNGYGKSKSDHDGAKIHAVELWNSLPRNTTK